MSSDRADVQDAAAIRELVRLGQDKQSIVRVSGPWGGPAGTVAVIGKDQQVVDLADKFPLCPDRVRTRVTMNSVASFVAYLNEFKTPDTRVFANTLAAPYLFVAVIDYHKKDGTAQWGSHVVVLSLTPTDEFKKWEGKDGDVFDQVNFAQFIEENVNDIVAPDGATMLELALTLEASQGMQFKGRVNLNNGDIGLLCDVNTDMKAGKDGTLAIPKEILIRIPIFRGVAPIDLKARFRTTVRPPTVGLSYQLIRLNAAVDKVIEATYDMITHEAAVPVYAGILAQDGPGSGDPTPTVAALSGLRR